MAASHTDPADTALVAYLASLSISIKNISHLAGGRANRLWRVNIDHTAQAATQLSLPETIVVKYAQPFVASSPSIPFPVDRMDFEANALSLMRDLPLGQHVTVPKLYHYGQERCMLLMSDGGQHNLKDSYALLSNDEVRNIGVSLAQWLCALHSQTRDLHIGAGGNETAKSIYRYAYAGLGRSIERWNLQHDFPGLADKVNDIYGEKLETDNDCVCMGDFWTGNVVVGEATGARSEPQCTVVDWEMVRRGCGGTDVGQFVAEAFLLDKFRSPSKDLATAFYESYLRHYGDTEEAAPSAEYLRRVGVHCGLHLAFWPTFARWADDEATKKVVIIGLRMITAALDEGQSPQAWYELMISKQL